MMTAKLWNRLYPPGTPVLYFPVSGLEDNEQSMTRSEAWELGSGIPIVKIRGRTGGVSLAHLVIKPKLSTLDDETAIGLMELLSAHQRACQHFLSVKEIPATRKAKQWIRDAVELHITQRAEQVSAEDEVDEVSDG